MFFNALINQCVSQYRAKYAVQDELSVEVRFREDLPPCRRGFLGHIDCISRDEVLETIKWEIRYVCHQPVQQQHHHILFEAEWQFYRWLAPVFNQKRSVGDMLPNRCVRADQSAIGLMLHLPHQFIAVQLPGHLDYAHLWFMATTIGQFHSYSFRLSVQQVEALSQGMKPYEPYLSCAELVMPTLRRCLDALLDSDYLTECQNMPGYLRLFNMVHKLDEEMSFLAEEHCRYSVFSNQHYTREQVAFRYEDDWPEEMRIVNWKTVAWTSLGVDLATLLFVNCNGEVRAEWMWKLLEVYYDTLITTFDTCDNVPSWTDVLFEVRRCVPVALSILGWRNSHPSGLWSDEFIMEVYSFLIDTFFI